MSFLDTLYYNGMLFFIFLKGRQNVINKIIVVNNENLSPREELVQDIISIFHIFSNKLYSLRKYKKQIKEDNDIAKELQN